MLPKQVRVFTAEEGQGKKKIWVLLTHFCSPAVSRCSLKVQEQVHCKFYNELGRILVKDFEPVPHLDEVQGEPEEHNCSSGIPSRDIGKQVFLPDSMIITVVILSVSFFICGPSDSVVGIQEDRKKVPWSDKETIILLEIWGDQQVKGDAHMRHLLILTLTFMILLIHFSRRSSHCTFCLHCIDCSIYKC